MASTIRSLNILDTAPAAALGAGVTENQDYTVTRACFVSSASVLATATVANSAARLSRQALGSGSFNVITASLAMAAAATLTRADSLVVAQYVCAATDVLRVAFTDGGAGGANGRFITELVNLPISGAA